MRGFVEPAMFVTPDVFEAHLDWLVASFAVVSIDDAVAGLRGEGPLPKRACTITFDDGWLDNYQWAYPLLRERDLPATVFLVADRVGTDGAFWPDEVCARLGALSNGEAATLVRRLVPAASAGPPVDVFLDALKGMRPDDRDRMLGELRKETATPEQRRELLDWSEVETMHRGGISFESHSVSHAILPTVTPDEARAELVGAREALEARGLGTAKALAYPSGAHDAQVRALAREAGYRAGLTMAYGVARAGDDPFELPRIPLHQEISTTRVDFHRFVPGFR